MPRWTLSRFVMALGAAVLLGGATSVGVLSARVLPDAAPAARVAARATVRDEPVAELAPMTPVPVTPASVTPVVTPVLGPVSVPVVRHARRHDQRMARPAARRETAAARMQRRS